MSKFLSSLEKEMVDAPLNYSTNFGTLRDEYANILEVERVKASADTLRETREMEDV